jgi:integrase
MGVKVKQHPKGSGIWYLFINHHGIRICKKIGKKKATAEAIA